MWTEESMVRLARLVGGEKVEEEAGDGAEVETFGVSTAVAGAGVRGGARDEEGGEATRVVGGRAEGKGKKMVRREDASRLKKEFTHDDRSRTALYQ